MCDAKYCLILFSGSGRIPPSVEAVQYNLAVFVELQQFVARFYTVVCFIDLKSREDSLKPVCSTLYVKFFCAFLSFCIDIDCLRELADCSSSKPTIDEQL